MKKKRNIEILNEAVRLSDQWLKAAVIGSLWASVEIVLGSFLHNIKMPLSGTVMSFISVMLLIAFSQIWKEKWIILRAGIICALMKSVSPSAIIIGPMIGITTEAFFLETLILVFGRNLPAYIIGGALAVSGVLIQKVISLLIAYGLNFAFLFHNLVEYAGKQLTFNGIEPETALYLLIGLYALTGALASITGYYLGKRTQRNVPDENPIFFSSYDRRHPLFEQNNPDQYNTWLLVAHFLALVASLYIISGSGPVFLVLPVAYIVFTLLRYKNIIRRLIRPFFWIQLLVITLLASLFLTGLKEGVVFSKQGIIAGLLMNLRALVIFVGFSAISVELRNPFIKKILYGKGFGKVYAAAGLAFGALPGILSAIPKGKDLIRRPGVMVSSMVSSGNALYRRFRQESEQSLPVFIVTGDVMKGKTSYTLDVVSRLINKEVHVEGFISKGVDQGAQRLGFDLINIITGERKLLSRKEPAPDSWLRFGRYCFDPEAFEYANRILEIAVETNPQLVVLDEVGPLELQNTGWTPVIESILSANRIAQLWVVRKSVIDKVIKKWNLRNVVILDITETDIESALEIINEKMLFFRT